LIWYLAWFADPVYKGDYPAEMKVCVCVCVCVLM
jgi:hypothetical protein